MKLLRRRSAHDIRIMLRVAIATICFLVGVFSMEYDDTWISFSIAMAGLLTIMCFVCANEERWENGSN